MGIFFRVKPGIPATIRVGGRIWKGGAAGYQSWRDVIFRKDDISWERPDLSRDTSGTGKLVVSGSPDVDFEFIPYPEEVKNMKQQVALQKVFGGKGGAINKGSGKNRNRN